MFASESRELAITLVEAPENRHSSHNNYTQSKDPPQRRPPLGRGIRRANRFDPNATRRIQGLYKYCIQQYFQEMLSKLVPSASDERECEELYSPITQFDVAMKLRSVANTAPGADKVEYNHLKRIDPCGKILSAIFNRC